MKTPGGVFSLVEGSVVLLGLLDWPGRAWIGLDCPEHAWIGLDWPGRAWIGLDCPGHAWIGLDWPGLAWTRLDCPGHAWIALDTPGLAWTRLDWPGLAWTGLDFTVGYISALRRGLMAFCLKHLLTSLKRAWVCFVWIFVYRGCLSFRINFEFSTQRFMSV